ncbi:hypothetical protein ACEXQD_06600 [Herbiconiux sp. P15]|uniref:hypothetical protein n=1 Tax=Herbiconiux liukaitaii TaxID=3342799 RepID=UPI0035BB146A
MPAPRDSRTFWRLVPTLLVAIVALSAVLLSVAALRQIAVSDGGTVPGPIPTWDDSGTTPEPTPTQTESAANVGPSERTELMDIDEGGSGLRASNSDCSSPGGALLWSTADGGLTWNQIDLGSTDLWQVYSVRVVSADQFDVVAAVTAECEPVTLTSYTSGQFWEAYPERTPAGPWIDPQAPDAIQRNGVAVPAPCGAALQVADLDPNMAVLCSEGLFYYASQSGTWSVVAPGTFVGVANGAGGSIVAAQVSPECSGITFTEFAATGEVARSTCDPTHSATVGSTLTSIGTQLAWWDGQTLAKSSDLGATWSP